MSGAANRVAAQTYPDRIPVSKPTDSAMRADSPSYTVAGDTQRAPASIARSLVRFSAGVTLALSPGNSALTKYP
jgi:hypothetical protein